MYTYQHPRPAVSVDIVLFQKNNANYRVLLIKRAQEPFRGSYALPGGFVEMEEDLESAAKRELEEETGVRDIQLTQIHTFSDPERDPRGRVISTAYGVVIDEESQLNIKAGSDATDAVWFNLSDLPPLAFDHQLVIKVTAKKLNILGDS